MVYIVPIQEWGQIVKVRKDSRGENIIEVKRESDGKIHLCRECELDFMNRQLSRFPILFPFNP